MAVVGVLALQGGFELHRAALEELGHRVQLVRSAAALEGLAGLVLPGGESTTQWRLLDGEPGFAAAITGFARERPVLATCAGLILAQRLGLLSVELERNGWGAQLDSFEAEADDATPIVLIRAPRITAVGEGVEVVRTYRREPVLVRLGHVWGATYHPELTTDRTLYRLFGDGDAHMLGRIDVRMQ
jgi:5'-phosphate synthase pdxT subunit